MNYYWNQLFSKIMAYHKITKMSMKCEGTIKINGLYGIMNSTGSHILCILLAYTISPLGS